MAIKQPSTVNATATIPILISRPAATATMPVSVTCNGNEKEPNDVTVRRNGLRNLNRLMLFALSSLLIILGGCASLSQKENTLAIVNGEHITKDDLKYSLEVAHRREDISSAGTLNLSQFILKLIDDRLIIQEARNMGMEEYPEVQQAVQEYILRESVVRLHDEEIVQKVQLTEKDIIDYYKKSYESLKLGIVEFNSEEEAKEQLELLKNGNNFTGKEIALNRYSVTPQMEKAISNLKPGEISDVIKTQHKYYIMKLIDKKEAPDEELERVRGSIEKAIRKRKERERSDEYLKYLRERSTIKIDHELLSTLKLNSGSNEEKYLLQNKTILAEVNGSTLTVGNFAMIATSNQKKSKEEILNDWIDRKIVDHEALSRHYEMKAVLGNMVDRYKNQLLKNTFIKRVIAPQVTISEEALKDYHLNHQKKFTRPDSFKIQQITVKSLDKAQDILDNLQKGADFSWLAKRWSVDTSVENGGEMGWLTESDMPKPVKEIVVTLKPGDVSPIIEIGSLYSIIRLQDRKEGEVEEFDKVKDAVYRACFEDQLNTILNKYVSQLKKDSEIKINDKAVASLKEKLQK